MISLITSCFIAALVAGDQEAPRPKIKADVWGAVIAEDAPVIVAFDREGTLFVLDAEDGEIRRRIGAGAFGGPVWLFDLDPSGECVAALTEDNRVWLWDCRKVEPPRVIATLPGGLPHRTGRRWGGCVEFSPGGKRILVGHGEGGVLLLDRDGRAVATYHSQDDARVPKTTTVWRTVHAAGWVTPRAWTRDGSRFALSTDVGPCVFDAASGEVLHSGLDVPDGRVECLAFDPSGALLASGHYRGEVALTRVRTGKRIWTHVHEDPILGVHDGGLSLIGVGGLEFSPDGRLLAATVNTSIHALLLDAGDGRRRWLGMHFGGRMGEPATVCWAPDGASFYHTYISGGTVGHVRLGAGDDGSSSEDPADLRVEERRAWSDLYATLPDIGWNGVGVHVAKRLVLGIDAKAGRRLWTTEL